MRSGKSGGRRRETDGNGVKPRWGDVDVTVGRRRLREEMSRRGGEEAAGSVLAQRWTCCLMLNAHTYTWSRSVFRYFNGRYASNQTPAAYKWKHSGLHYAGNSFLLRLWIKIIHVQRPWPCFSFSFFLLSSSATHVAAHNSFGLLPTCLHTQNIQRNWKYVYPLSAFYCTSTNLNM